MATLARRSQRSSNIWPGFVDALATLLMVIIFLLMVFVLAQFFLGEAISGRDQALQKLHSQVSGLAEMLALERKTNEDLRLNVTQLSEELQASVIKRDELNATMHSLTQRAETAEKRAGEAEKKIAMVEIRAGEAEKKLAAAELKAGEADVMIQDQLRKISKLSQDIAALQALKEEMEQKIAGMSGKLDEAETRVVEEHKLSESARAQVALLNKQMAALRDQLAQLSNALDIAESKAEAQDVQIVSLGKRLNAALATKVHELSRYRSEFFGRLRQVLGDQRDVRIVGDRFVFQSEVLFSSGSALLGEEGKVQLGRLAQTLREISAKIPDDIEWILRVDGHTDRIPIQTEKFPSNWELSSARAISVVSFLTEQGIPPNRLTAAGFGEHQPLDNRVDEIAMRRNRRIELKLTQH